MSPKWQTYLKDRPLSVETETSSATLQLVKGESGLSVESAAATEIRFCQFPCDLTRLVRGFDQSPQMAGPGFAGFSFRFVGPGFSFSEDMFFIQ